MISTLRQSGAPVLHAYCDQRCYDACALEDKPCTQAGQGTSVELLNSLAPSLADSGLGMKRARGPDAVGDLQQHSKQLRMMGQDPLPATLHQAQLASLHQGPFSQVRVLISLLCIW